MVYKRPCLLGNNLAAGPLIWLLNTHLFLNPFWNCIIASPFNFWKDLSVYKVGFNKEAFTKKEALKERRKVQKHLEGGGGCNEVSTHYDMNYGQVSKEVCNRGVACSLLKLDGSWQATPSIKNSLQVRYPTLVLKLINFTKAEPLFGTWSKNG